MNKYILFNIIQYDLIITVKIAGRIFTLAYTQIKGKKKEYNLTII